MGIYEIYKELYPTVSALNPALFNKNKPKPLDYKIVMQVENRTNLTKTQIESFFEIWCNRCEYRAVILFEANRFNIEGIPVTTVTPWERRKALTAVAKYRRPTTIESVDSVIKLYNGDKVYAEIENEKIRIKTAYALRQKQTRKNKRGGRQKVRKNGSKNVSKA